MVTVTMTMGRGEESLIGPTGGAAVTRGLFGRQMGQWP